MQPAATPIERNAQLDPGQARQALDRARLGRTGVGRRDDADARARPPVCADRGDRLQHVPKLAQAAPRDKAHQHIHPIGRGELGTQLGEQRRIGPAGREQPRRGQAGRRRRRRRAVLVNRPQYRNRSLPFRRGDAVAADRREQPIDHVELAALAVGFVIGFAGRVEQLREQPRNLGRQATSALRGRQKLDAGRAARVQCLDERAQVRIEQQVVESVW